MPPRDPFIREKFTRERTAARKLAAEYFQRFLKERYQTEVESWRELQAYLLYQCEADLVIAVGCAQVRKVPRHQCRCDTSTARILSDAQPLFGRYEYKRELGHS